MDNTTFSEYMKAQSILKKLNPEEVAKLDRKRKAYEIHKEKMRAKSHEKYSKLTDQEKLQHKLHVKELAHKRKQKLFEQKKVDYELEILRAKRVNPEGPKYEQSETTFDDFRSDIYCSTCDKTPEPPKSVQNIFKKLHQKNILFM